MVAGVDSQGGSRIVPLSKVKEDEQLQALDASTRAPDRENDTTGECAFLLQMLSLIFTIPVALRGRADKHGVPSDILNEQPDQDASGVHSDTSRLEGQVAREDEDPGTLAERLSIVTPKPASDGGWLDEDAQGTVQPRRSCGECWRPSSIPSVKSCHLQSLREPGRTWPSGLLPFSLASRRTPKMGSVLSEPSWRTSPPFTPVLKCAYLITSTRNSSLTNLI